MDRVIDAALARPAIVLLLTGCLAGYALYSLTKVPVDAFPDVTPTMVQLFTTAPGLSAEDIEATITVPIETSLYGLPHLESVQSLSQFGLSAVNVYFGDDIDVYLARQLVSDRLRQAGTEIPSEFGPPQLGPISSGLGDVLMYRLVCDPGSKCSLMVLRTLQDWVVKPLLRTIPGIADVLSVGGYQRQYEVRLDENALLARRISASLVRDALQRDAGTIGAGTVDRGSETLIVRGDARLNGQDRALRDINETLLTDPDGVPVLVHDVATVGIGAVQRTGAQVSNGEESVGGDVVKLLGSDTAALLPLIAAKLHAVGAALPKGVRIDTYYSQASLIRSAIRTVSTALVEGSVLVLAVLFAMLGNLRAALIVILVLPLSALSSLIGMRWLGLSANLMSLGGLAIAIGMMVDGAVVMVENIERRLGSSLPSPAPMDQRYVLMRAAHEVARPIAFAVLIIIAVFLPLFTLQGIEGKMFRPMAYVVALALAASLILSTTLIPVLTNYMLRRHPSPIPRIVVHLQRLYGIALDWVLRRPARVIAGATVLFTASLLLVPHLGTEFVPTLREGTFYVESTLPPGASLATTIGYTKRIEAALRQFPEVLGSYSRVGRTEIGGDPDPINVTATTITLRPFNEWPSGISYENLETAMAARLARDVPEVANNFSQPIQLRTDELITGIKAQVAISIYGDDLAKLQALSRQMADIAAKVPGAVDVGFTSQAMRAEVVFTPNRIALARHGMSVADVLSVLGTGVGGTVVGQVFEGARHFDLNVRLQEAARSDVGSIAALPLTAPDGSIVRLDALGTVAVEPGPASIYRNDGSRRAIVTLNVRDRDLGSVVADIQASVQREIVLPTGYRVAYGGQFENEQRAMERLEVVVPTVLALIFALLCMAFRSVRLALLVFMNVPFSLSGGVATLWLAGMYLSVPAAVGFIAVFGIAVLNGVVLVSYIERLRSEGVRPTEAARDGAILRLRPVLMTALVTILGLIPLLLANGIGAEVQRPLAAVVVGGLVTATLLTLFIIPSAYAWLGHNPRGSDRGI